MIATSALSGSRAGMGDPRGARDRKRDHAFRSFQQPVHEGLAGAELVDADEFAADGPGRLLPGPQITAELAAFLELAGLGAVADHVGGVVAGQAADQLPPSPAASAPAGHVEHLGRVDPGRRVLPAASRPRSGRPSARNLRSSRRCFRPGTIRKSDHENPAVPGGDVVRRAALDHPTWTVSPGRLEGRRRSRPGALRRFPRSSGWPSRSAWRPP